MLHKFQEGFPERLQEIDPSISQMPAPKQVQQFMSICFLEDVIQLFKKAYAQFKSKLPCHQNLTKYGEEPAFRCVIELFPMPCNP